jgi:hypothetical protein
VMYLAPIPDTWSATGCTIVALPASLLNTISRTLLRPAAKVKVIVILRLTVSQSVSLGVEPHLGLMTRYCYSLPVTASFCGAPSLTRGRVCLLYMLLALASVIFFGSDSVGTRDQLFSTKLFCTTTFHGLSRKHRCCVFADPLLGSGFFYFCVRVHFHRNLFTEPLPSNKLFRVSGVASQYSDDLL